MSAFDKAIKLQKSIDNNLKEKESTEELLEKLDDGADTEPLYHYIDECSKEVNDDLKKLNDLGYEYMEHNMTSSIRKIRNDDD